GHPEWAADERFATNAQRVRNVEQMSAMLREEFSRRDRASLLAQLDRAGVPCGPINSVAEVFEEPQTVARGMLRYVDHPSGGRVPQVASPIRFSQAEPADMPPPPTLGQHSAE